ncbi:KH domain family protein [Acanthocheilonema viteae]
MQANMKYLTRLLKEKEKLKALPNIFKFKHSVLLIDKEIAKIRGNIKRMTEVNEERAKKEKSVETSEREIPQKAADDKPPITTNGKKVLLQEKIFIPVNEYPNYNFVGRILGPRGMTAKQLEEESGCRIMVRGRGSIREGSSHRQTIYNDNMKENLHVLVQCEDFEEAAKDKMKRAVECIRYMLIPPPDGEDELKRKQLLELSIINGTYRPTIASRIALRNRSLFPAISIGQIRAENTVHGVNNLPVFANGSNESNRRATLYDESFAQQYSYNAYTINTRQALASLGFDMDAFEVTDCYGKRLNRATAGVPRRQQTITPTAAQYPRFYGLDVPFLDPFTMKYMWNSVNSPIFGVYDNSSREYYNHIMTGIASANGESIASRMAQPSNIQPLSLQQYITAAALLNGMSNFRNDGSGDGPSSNQ